MVQDHTLIQKYHYTVLLAPEFWSWSSLKEAVGRYREQQDAIVEEKSREISMLIENKNKEVSTLNILTCHNHNLYFDWE